MSFEIKTVNGLEIGIHHYCLDDIKFAEETEKLRNEYYKMRDELLAHNALDAYKDCCKYNPKNHLVETIFTPQIEERRKQYYNLRKKLIDRGCREKFNDCNCYYCVQPFTGVFPHDK